MFNIETKEQRETGLWNTAQTGNGITIVHHSHPYLVPWVRLYVGLKPPRPLNRGSIWLREKSLLNTISSKKGGLCLDTSQAEGWDYLRKGLKTVMASECCSSWFFTEQQFSILAVHWNHLEILSSTHTWVPPREVLICMVWDQTWGLEF